MNSPGRIREAPKVRGKAEKRERQREMSARNSLTRKIIDPPSIGALTSIRTNELYRIRERATRE